MPIWGFSQKVQFHNSNFTNGKVKILASVLVTILLKWSGEKFNVAQDSRGLEVLHLVT